MVRRKKKTFVSIVQMEKCKRQTHFLASNHFEPSNFGSNGMTLSSARKSPFSFNNSRRASNALNFPFNFAIPTTRDINLMFLLSRRSLYSRCGSFVIKQIDVVLGSTRGCSIGLDVKKTRCQTTDT